MRVFPARTLDELEPLADDWDRLSGGMPFRSWAWLSTWWRHYGNDQADDRQLCVPCVFDHHDRLVGVAPWYTSRSRAWGCVIRFLGDGEVCSDYLSVLCQAGLEDDVAQALADWLLARCSGESDPWSNGPEEDWGLLELASVDAQDAVVPRLAQGLVEGGGGVDRREGMSCWRVELPSTVDEYAARFSKHARKRFRQLLRGTRESGKAILHTAQNVGEFSEALEILIDLHQRRRRSLGQPGCYASERFAAFHRDVAPRMFLAGHAQLHVLRHGGRPVAAEYQLCGDGIVYAYQTGIEPERLDLAPGRMCQAAILRWAIENGYRAYDMLRGDEPYKRHWRTERRAIIVTRIVAPRLGPRLCYAAWRAGQETKDWLKKGLSHVRP
ncbi:MAG: GNAT family N-acetyltransferase [Pirellulaceae bacterium]|nr:GNAT family N-acetyltransferase [Pirellulaceae bacterium]